MATKKSQNKRGTTAPATKTSRPSGSKSVPANTKAPNKNTGDTSKITNTEAATTEKETEASFSADQFFSTPKNLTQNLTKTMETFMTKPDQIDQISKETEKAFKDGSEAFVKSGSLAMKGFEDYLKTVTDLLKESAEKQTNAYKELLQCKTLNELAETQNTLAQKAWDDTLKGAAQLSELSVKICTDSIEPLNEHMTNAYKQTTSKLAA